MAHQKVLDLSHVNSNPTTSNVTCTLIQRTCFDMDDKHKHALFDADIAKETFRVIDYLMMPKVQLAILHI